VKLCKTGAWFIIATEWALVQEGRVACMCWLTPVQPLQDYDKRTALHLASSQGHIKIVEFLISKGAEVNCTDRMGFSPLVVPCHRTAAAARAKELHTVPCCCPCQQKHDSSCLTSGKITAHIRYVTGTHSLKWAKFPNGIAKSPCTTPTGWRPAARSRIRAKVSAFSWRPTPGHGCVSRIV